MCRCVDLEGVHGSVKELDFECARLLNSWLRFWLNKGLLQRKMRWPSRLRGFLFLAGLLQYHDAHFNGQNWFPAKTISKNSISVDARRTARFLRFRRFGLWSSVFGPFVRRCTEEKMIGKVGWLIRPAHIIK